MKRLLFVVVGLLLVLFGGVLLWRSSHPTYDGRTPQEWFALALRDRTNLPAYAVAFRRLGDPGSAFLAQELTRQPPRYLNWYDQVRRPVSRYITLPPVPPQSNRLNEIECAKRLLGHLETNAAPALIRKLKQAPANSRKYVVQALGELGPAAGEQVGPCLTRCLQDSSTEVCYEAIASLGMVLYRPEDTVPRLLPLLKHPSQRVRLEAAYTLGNYPPKPEITLEPLRAALEDQDGTVRANAARALGKMGTYALPAARQLRERLSDAVLPAGRAAEALVLIEPEARTSQDGALEQALGTAEASSDDYFRLMALSSRLRRGEDAKDFVETCLRQLARWHGPAYVRWEAVERLQESKLVTDAVNNALWAAVADSNGHVRQKAKGVAGEPAAQSR
jgi:HEAT repeat protein